MASSKAEKLALNFIETRLDPTKSSHSLISQIEHRLELVSFWDILPGSRVLEIGCGQGDCSIVLADAVGRDGHIDAVDPGAPDYGAPFTLFQAQSHISSSYLGPRITFHLQTTPQAYLQSYTGPPYDYVILCHCIYYFATPALLPSLITHVTSHSRKLCIAEWSLRASGPASHPHVQATLLLAMLEARRGKESRGNVRTVFSPAQIASIILNTTTTQTSDDNAISKERPFTLLRTATLPTNPGMLDAYWEINDLQRNREREVKLLRANGVSEAEMVVVQAMYDAVMEGLRGVEGGVEGVRCMDFWVGVFEREE